MLSQVRQVTEEAAGMNVTTVDAPAPPSPSHATLKAPLSVLPCLFFFYINAVMMVALFQKPQLLETCRYILFGHLLLTESLQLLISVLLYLFALTKTTMLSYICISVILFASLTLTMSPLNLAVMSLERYIAICCPLKHVHIVTSRMTGVAIAFIWTTGSLESLTHWVLFISLNNTRFIVPRFCNKANLFPLPIFSSISNAFTIAYFVVVSVVIIYTYVAILVIVNSASSRSHNASKAGKTVLLHLIQLCLCLVSTLFDVINYNSKWNMQHVVASHIQYTIFISLIIFPKCLSPLIYGLRDQALRQILQSYIPFRFTAAARTFAGS